MADREAAWRPSYFTSGAVRDAVRSYLLRDLTSSQPRRLTREPLHLAIFPRRQRGLRQHPRAADAEHIRQGEVRRSFGEVDAAGRAEAQGGDGRGQGGEMLGAADGFRGEEFQVMEAELHQRDGFGGRCDAGQKRNGRLGGGFGKPRRSARADEKARAGVAGLFDLLGRQDCPSADESAFDLVADRADRLQSLRRAQSNFDRRQAAGDKGAGLSDTIGGVFYGQDRNYWR